MNPIYIRMSAFGSYAGVETVDFSDVNHGIFLITGDTGAGKTTIFDAITYALYDDTSGGKRDGEMMRSQFAEEEIRTFVTLKFSYNEEIYTITRYPRQNRISKRKNKDGEYTLTVDQPSVELIMPDGMVFPGKMKETNQKIVDIVGLDRNQFTQIAMIAQGDFLKLLHAPSKERKEIFSKIFDTRIYWRIEEELKSRAKAMYGQLEDNRKDIVRETENIQYRKEEQAFSEGNVKPTYLESDPDKLLELIRLLIDEAKEKEEEINHNITERQLELDGLNIKLQQAEGINRIFLVLDELKRAREALESKRDGMEVLKAQMEAAKKASFIEGKEMIYLAKQREVIACEKRISERTIWLESNNELLQQQKLKMEESESVLKKDAPKLSAKIVQIQDLLPKYERYDSMAVEAEGLKKKLWTIGAKLSKTVENNEKASLRKVQLDQEQSEHKPLMDQIELLTQTMNQLSERKKFLEGLCVTLQSIHNLKRLYDKAEEAYKTSVTESKERTKEYDQKYHEFIEGQAALLASTLEEGAPCPVCGSLTHPMVTITNGQKVSQSELDSAKKSMDDGNKNVLSKLEEFQTVKHKYEGTLQLAEHEGKRLLGEEFTSNPQAYDRVNAELFDCEKQLKEAIKNRETAISAKTRYERNEAEVKELIHVMEGYTQEKEELEYTLKEKEILLAQQEASLKALREALIYNGKQEALSEIAAAGSRITELEQSNNRIVKSYQLLLNEITKKQGELSTEGEMLIRLSLEKEEASELFLQEVSKQGFEDIHQYRKAILTSDEIDSMNTVYQNYREEWIKNTENLKNYSEQTEGKTKVDTQEMLTKREELFSIKNKLEKESKELYGVRTGNESIYERINKLLAIRTSLKERYSNITRLDNTANGKLSHCHLNFQTYIQRRYFNYVIREANKRLYIMSNSQFLLRCRDVKDLAGQGEVGLDLDVYSLVNDQTRDVKTLSGGESFIAALAMALGMADIIQNSAGRIHIDTMFIDEGFGSLSDETRMQAIKILNDLSEGKRLVGIISHVTELKAQIETKLVVTKSEKGSRVKWELG